MKGILADLASTAIKACVDGLKDLAGAAVDAWKAFDDGRDTVIKLTGATGDAADRLMQSYGNVSKVVLADSSDIGNAIGEVNTRWGVTGDELTDLSAKYLKFSKITDSDVIGSVDDTHKALSAYGKGIESVGGFLDALAATSQATGVNTGTLTSGIISNATAFQEMGLSLEQAVAFMGQLEKSGTNSETVLNGMRKALKNSTKDGKSMNQALLDLQKQIESNGNSTKGLQAAYDLFGKSGDQIYGAIKNGTLSFKDLTNALDSTSGTVDKTYAATMDATDKLKLKFQEMKFTLAQTFDGFLQENSPMLEEAIDQIGDAIISVMPAISSALTEILPYITDFIKNDLPVLIEDLKNELPGIIENVIKRLPDLISMLEKAIPQVMELVNFIITNKDTIIGAIEAIVVVLTTGKIVSAVTNIIYAVKDLGIAFKGVSASVGAFGTVFGTVMAGVVSFLAGAEIGKKLGAWLFPEDADLYEHYSGISGTFEMIRDLVVTIGEEIYYKWQDVIQFFKDAWSSVKEFAVDAWNGIKEAFGNAVEWFTKLFEGISKAIGKVMDGVVGIVKKPINAIISLLNTFIDGLNKIQVPDWVPTVGGKGINIPHIKQLAEGGVLRKGQMGFLEGNGAEAVVPLDQNRKWIHAVSQDLRESLASEGLVGSGQLGTRKLGNTIYNFNQTNNSPRALNRLEIYRQTRNQLAMVNGGV
jgi:phage-related minor tail protein